MEGRAFSCSTAYSALQGIAGKKNALHIFSSFHRRYLEALLQAEADKAKRARKPLCESDLARLCFEKLETCVSGFSQLNDWAREMDKNLFKELFFSGSFQVCGIHKLYRTPIAYNNVGRKEKGTRRLVRNSPKYKATMMSNVWAYLTLVAQAFGGACDCKKYKALVVADEVEREMLQFNPTFTMDEFLLLKKLFPVPANVLVFGISRVVMPCMSLVRKAFPVEDFGVDFLYRDEDLIDHLSRYVDPSPGQSQWMPEYLAEANGNSDDQGSENGTQRSFVPYDSQERRNVFMIEKLLDDAEIITVADVYNNPDYDWDGSYLQELNCSSKDAQKPSSTLAAIEEEESSSEEVW